MMQIVVISKDENFHSIQYILESFKEYKVFLIAPKAIYSKYSANNLVKINDNDILEFDTLRKQLNLDRFGWYYQQFLKYQAVLTLDGEDFLIIDGDTIISSCLAKNNTLFTTGRPTVKGYYNLYEKIFPEHKLYGRSFITNQMVFKKSYLQELLKEIEKDSSKGWIAILADLVKTNDNFMFSEYQMYAEYILNNKHKIDIKHVSIFRRMDLIDDSVKNSLNKYNILAYENHHKAGFLRLIRAKIYYLLKLSIG